MKMQERNPAIRQGQFLWMDDPERKQYIASLKKKISDGFYSSEKVISGVVDEIAPILHEIAGQE